MSDSPFNIAKGRVVEKFADSAAAGLVLLLTVNEVETTLVDYDTVEAMLAGSNTEATFTNYARKTGITGTITVDDANDRVDVDIPDQVWSSAGNGTNETLTKLIVAYEEAVSPPDDGDRIPLTQHDFAVTTDSSDLTAEINAAGFFRAS